MQFDKVLDAQQVYRLLLDAMARPGKINTLSMSECLKPPRGLQSGTAAVALTLLDQGTGFCFLSAGRQEPDYLTANTGAAAQSVDVAELIIFSGCECVQLDKVCCGSLLSPEQGATLLIMVEELSSTEGRLCLRLTGPGIRNHCDLFINGLALKNLETISCMNKEFPLGIDVIYTDKSGNVACIPRSSSMHWKVKG
ncbi:phosphonate C-P lyase system protein PhnH [Pectinatus haikarae]|uniref:phosphonate C-P lyase system protein PhnH n=1 Tax=Pectinatus haikarae TaxID=349096 RepID=UPI0027D77186|nr:phosphonate C-P lyase system protein PhnH [Pectinatus haikarae]